MQKSKLPKIASVEVQELLYAYQVGGLAADGKIPGSGVGGMGVNVDMGGGDVTRFDLTDVPINRAAIAIRDQFPKGMLLPLVSRIMALNELMQRPESERFKRYSKDGSGEVEVSEAVFKVAARMPLNSKMSFAPKQFFRQVTEEYEKEPDLSDAPVSPS